jgi:hypothetical protein
MRRLGIGFSAIACRNELPQRMNLKSFCSASLA